MQQILIRRNDLDMSGAFKRLQSERSAAEIVLQEYTPLQTLADTEAVRAHFIGNAAAAAVRFHSAVSLGSVQLSTLTWMRSGS
jgi:hypothetical protein